MQNKADALVTSLLRASRALVGVSVRALADVEDAVTLTQFRTLVVLERHERTTVAELACGLGVNASTAQRQVDRLVALALVERRENPADRRQVVLALTCRGVDLVRGVNERRTAVIASIVTAMEPDEHGALVRALESFALAAGEPEELMSGAARYGW